MTPERRRPSSGINLTNVRDVAIAQGQNAQANNKVTHTGPPEAAVLARIEDELAQLRERLDGLRASGTDQLEPDTVTRAQQDVSAIEAQVHTERPDPDVITHHLGRLSMVLAGIAGVADNLARLGRSLGSLIGLG